MASAGFIEHREASGEAPGSPFEVTTGAVTANARRSWTVVVMGVCGCGKTTVGRALAASTGAVFIEGDEFHPPENVARMRAGIPLTDADRTGWLDALARRLADGRARGERMVLACSVLKRRYRDRLRQAAPDLRLAYLAGPRDLIISRMAARTGHYMPVQLIESQFRDLEPPGLDESAVTCDIRAGVKAICAQIADWLATPTAGSAG